MQNVVHSSSAEKQRNGVKHEVRAQPSQSGPGQTPTSAATTTTTKSQLLVPNINQSQPAGKANPATLNIRSVLQNSGKTLASHKARKVLISQSTVLGAGQEPGLSARLGGGDPIPEFSSPTFPSDSDDDVSEVESFSIEPSDLCEDVLDGRFLLSHSGSLPVSEAELQRIDPETQARIEALLEAAGIGKLSADGKRFGDPEVLSRLTSSVSCALDEAAAALTRMRTDASGVGQSVGLAGASSSSSVNAATHPNEPSSGRSDDDTVRFGGSSVGGVAGSCSSSTSASAVLPRRSLAEACNEGDVHAVRRLLDEGRSVHETTEEGESLLSLACSAGYYELAQVLLAMRANVEDKGLKQDCTPLMEAASAGNVDIVRLLIDHNADVNAQSASGNTPLMYACASGHEEVVRLLLEAGANVEDHNENGHTPLMEAASAGHVGVARILLEHGAGINTHSNEFKESALTLACYKGHLEMVRFLLEAGADQEHKTDEMHTALMEASMDGHVEVARLLLDSGAQVNMPADSFESPLTLAACGGHVELAMLLLERGANIEEVNDEGYTPLMEAAREGHEEMVALLLSQGADINAQTEETQETALTLACCGGFLEVADFLIKAGADLELGASTPLMEAAQEGHLELVRYLLEAGASVLAQTGTGDTALTYAAENGHTDVTELLLQYGADLEHVSEGGRTPLMKAARAGHLCAVQFLLSKGADVNRQTSSNDHTPLSLACAGGHVAVVELLLLHGANPFHRLKDNSTMIIEAAKSGHTQVVQLLLDYPNSILVSSESAQFALGIQATQAAAAAGVTASGPEDTAYLGMPPLAPIPAPRVPPHGRLEPQGAAPPTPASTASGTLPTITLGGKTEGTLANGGGGTTTATTVTATPVAASASSDRRSLASKSKLEQPFVTAEVQQTRNSPDEGTTEEEDEDDLEDELKLVEPPPSPTSSISSTTSTVKREAENKVSLGVSPFKLSLPRLGLEEFSENSQCAEELEFIERELHEKTEKAGGVLSAFSPLHSGTGTTINLEDIVKMFGENLSEQPKVDIKAVADLVASATLSTLPAPPVSTSTSALGLMRESVIVTNPNIVTTSALSLITTQLTTAIASSSFPPTSSSAGATVSSVATIARQDSTTIPLPPADRPKAKPVSKKDNKNVKKQQQWQVALQQQNQQLEQLQQLQQLNQHLQQQVLQQRQLKQQNQATLAALQQNAIQNQVQLAALQQNVAQLQQLEQQVLAPALAGAAAASSSASSGTGSRGSTSTTSTATTTQAVSQASASAAATAQFQQRVQQILQQKQQLQQQIRQFQLQVEQQLAFPQSGTLPPLVGRLDRGPEEGSSTSSDAAALEAIIQPLEDMKLTPDLSSTSSRAEKRSIDLTEETLQLSTAAETSSVAQQQLPFLSPDAVGMLSYPPHLSCPSYSTAAQTTAALQLHYQQLQAAAAGLQSMSQQATAGTGVGGVSGSSVTASQASQALQQQQLTLHHQLLLQSRQMLQGQTIPLFDSNLPMQSSSYPSGTFTQPQALQLATPVTTVSSVAPPILSSPEKKVTKGGKKGAKGQQGTTVSAVTPSGSVSSMSTAVQTSVPHGLQQSAQTATNLYPGLSLDGSGSGLAASFSCNGAPPPHASYFPVTSSSSASAANVTIPDMLAAAAYPAHYPTHPHPLLHTPHGQATEDGLMVATPAAALQDTYSQYLAANGVSTLPMAGTGGVAGGAASVPDLPDYSLPLGYLTTGAPTQVAVSVPVAVVPSGHSAHPGTTQSAGTGQQGHGPSGPNTPRGTPYPQADLDSETESNHDTALTLACTGGHEELVELLLSRGADIEHRDKKGFTPLILAATAGHEKVCEILLTHGANIEAQSERTKDTPLSLSCSGGRFEVVDLLLNRGANKEHRNVSDYTPLSLAASGGYVNIIRLLLAHGAEINSRTGSKLGISPLMLAAMNGHVTAVRTLLDMGSDINAQIETNRNTALTLACFQGRHEVVQLLLEKKANVEHRAKTGLTPLMEAASGGYVEVGRVLLEYGADVNAPPVPSSRDTALTIAADKGHVEFVDLLLKHGAQEDVKNKKGNSPLWLAANGGHLEVVELLYKANADIDSQDNRKVSCLMAAFRKGHIKVVKWMVKRVSQFPSDQEMTRYITTITDKELLKKCHHCLEVIRTAKDHQAAEANKNATNLLEELDMEKIRQDMKRQAAARRREKKKKKKAEKKEEKKKDDDGDDEEDERKEEENEDHETEDYSDVDVNDVNDLLRNNQHSLKSLRHRMHEDTNGNLDTFSHLSSAGDKLAPSSQSAAVSSNNNSKKKYKKNETIKDDMDRKPNGVLITPTVELPPAASVSPPTPTSVRNNAKRKKDSSNPSSSSSSTMVQTAIQEFSTSKTGKNVNKTLHDGFTVLDTLKEVSTSVLGSLASPKRGAKREEGWTVVRKQPPTRDLATAPVATKKPSATDKSALTLSVIQNGERSKKVSVPASAISRVIGRAGCNINAIREISGAHIEVEKQGKNTGDRSVLIKGTAESTKQAQMLIAALIKEPDKEFAELLAKYRSQAGSSQNQAALSSAITAKAARAVAGTVVTTSNSIMTSSQVKALTTALPSSTTAWGMAQGSPKKVPLGPGVSGTITPPLIPAVTVACLAGVTKSPAVRQLFPAEGTKKSSAASATKAAAYSVASITLVSAATTTTTSVSTSRTVQVASSATSTTTTTTLSPSAQTSQSFAAKVTESVGPIIAKKSSLSSVPAFSAVGGGVAGNGPAPTTSVPTSLTGLSRPAPPPVAQGAGNASISAAPPVSNLPTKLVSASSVMGLNTSTSMSSSTTVAPGGIPSSVANTALYSSSVSGVGSMSSSGSSQGGLGSRPGSTSPVQEYSPFNNLFSKSQPNIWPKDQGNKSNSFASVAAGPLANQAHGSASRVQMLSDVAPVEAPPTVDLAKAPGYRGNLQHFSHAGDVFANPSSSQASQEQSTSSTSMTSSAPGTPVPSAGQTRTHHPRPHPLTPPPRIGSPLPLFNPAPMVPPHQRDRSTPPGPPSSILGHTGPASASLAPGGPTSTRLAMNFGAAEGLNPNQFEGIPFPPMFRTQAPPPPPRFPGPHHRYAGNQGLFSAMPYQSKLNPNAPDFSSSRGPPGAGGGFPGPNPGVIGNRMPFPSMFNLGMAARPVDPVAGIGPGHHPSSHAHQPFGTDFPPPIGTPFAAPPSNPDLHRMMNFPPRLPPTSMTLLNAPPPSSTPISPRPATNPDSPSAVPNPNEHLSHPPPSQPHPRPIGDDRDRKLPRPIGTERAQSRRTPAFPEMAMWGSSGGQNANVGSGGATAVGNAAGNFGDVMHQPLGQHSLGPNDWMLGGTGSTGVGLQGPTAAPGGPVGDDALMFLHKQSHQQQLLQRHLDAIPNVEQNIDVTYQNGGHFGPSGHGFLNGLPPQMLPIGNVFGNGLDVPPPENGLWMTGKQRADQSSHESPTMWGKWTH